MARNADVVLGDNVWTELSNGETISGVVSIQNKADSPLLVLATTGTTAPAATVYDGNVYLPREADARTLAAMFPGLSSPIRLWGRMSNGGEVMVSYA